MKQGLQFSLFLGMLLSFGIVAGALIPTDGCQLNSPGGTAYSDEIVAAPLNASELPPGPMLPPTGIDETPFAFGEVFNGPSGEDDPEATRRLIRQSFPDAAATTVDAWAETFRGMPAAEIVDILAQKKLLSGSLDSIFTPGLQSPGLHSPLNLTSPRLGDSLHEREQAASRQNLKHAWTVGYRRRMVLPHAAAAGAAATSALDFIDFSSGRHVRSPQPLHVAFADHPLHMFLLQDGRLTRRGDFSILPAGMLGITTADGPSQLRGALRIDDRQRRLRVTETGELQAAADGDSWSPIGRIPVAEILRPELLTTDDGVHFQSGAPEAWREVLPGEIRLLPGTLELSNVDPAEELQRLDALDR